MSKITIEVESGWDSCEDCGSYGWEDIVVKQDGVELLHHLGDDHLGGGMWEYDWIKAIKEILESLSYDVEVVNEG